MIPSNGNNATGRSEVTASGTASVIHQTAISKATASVFPTKLLSGSIFPNKIIESDTSGVTRKLIMDFIFNAVKIVVRES